jgi:hypothetical protein
MNNSKTPKIVVGIGLAAIYATAVAALVPRGGHDGDAQNASAARHTQTAPEPALSSAISTASAHLSMSGAAQPAIPVAPSAPIASTTAKADVLPGRQDSEVGSQSRVQPDVGARMASPANNVEVQGSASASEGSGIAHDSGANSPEVSEQSAAVVSEGAVDATTSGSAPESDASASTGQ